MVCACLRSTLKPMALANHQLPEQTLTAARLYASGLTTQFPVRTNRFDSQPGLSLHALPFLTHPSVTPHSTIYFLLESVTVINLQNAVSLQNSEISTR